MSVLIQAILPEDALNSAAHPYVCEIVFWHTG